MFDSIDPQAVRVVRAYEILNPAVQGVDDGLVFGIDIREWNIVITEPALLYVSLVIIIRYEAKRVEVCLYIEGRQAIEFHIRWRREGCHVIYNNIQHEIHATIMHSTCERLEVIGASEMRVQIIDICGPVSMVRLSISCIIGNIFHNGRDPNSVEAHRLNIGKLVDDALP